ncbi:SDR family oxidoreductase [Sporobolomyces salmoneus]|uniref:SDR family oxidoreductase n=1 Tax=Sporobolomyces salmoneus TaxID=183962 RepID=UPI00317193B0
MSQKVVMVTGCSEGGIGYALCQEFSRKNCIVYATARRLSSIESLPPSVHKLALDVLSLESCNAAVEQIIREQGRIDVLVNNAGAGGTGALLDAELESDEGAKATFETNVWAPLRLSKLVVPHMVEKRSGLVINVGSIVGNVATPWSGIYCASKAALHSLTETLRMEVKGFGVNVMLIAPGAITSQFGKKQMGSFKMPEDTLYRDVADEIAKRAEISQRQDHTTPAPVLASGIVSRALSSSPATYYTAGGKSWIFWLFERIPRSIVWFLLSRQLGTYKVGQKRLRK